MLTMLTCGLPHFTRRFDVDVLFPRCWAQVFLDFNVLFSTCWRQLVGNNIILTLIAILCVWNTRRCEFFVLCIPEPPWCHFLILLCRKQTLNKPRQTISGTSRLFYLAIWPNGRQLQNQQQQLGFHSVDSAGEMASFLHLYISPEVHYLLSGGRWPFQSSAEQIYHCHAAK